jgi:hypothetical protein
MPAKANPTEAQDVAAQLAALAGKLSEAAEDEAAKAAALKEIEEFLGNIPMKNFPDLAESPAVQSFVRMLGVGDLRPGEVAKRGTLAERQRDWTMRDLETFKQVTLTPRETLTVTFNGLSVQFIDDQEITVPEPFANIYREHRKALEQAKVHEDYMLGYTDRAPDHNWVTSESATVRAFSQMGPRPDPRMRGIGPIRMDTDE